MGQFVILLLLSSCFATGLGLQCYDCVSDGTLVNLGLVNLPVSADCSSDFFIPDTFEIGAVQGPPDGIFLPVIRPAYCIKMVIGFQGLLETTLRAGFSSPAGNFNLSDWSNLIPGNLLNSRLSPKQQTKDIQTWLMDPYFAISNFDVGICNSNFCNSVSGLRHSNAALVMSVVVLLMATLANTFN